MWEIGNISNLSGIVAVIIAGFAFLQSSRANLRAKNLEKQKDSAAKGKAYYALDHILDLARNLVVKNPNDLTEKVFKADQDILNQIAVTTRESVDSVIPVFPELLTKLNSLAYISEKLGSVQKFEVDDILDRIWFVVKWRDLYGHMLSLAVKAASRGLVTGHYIRHEERFQRDPYIRPIYERANAFGMYGIVHGYQAISIEVRTGRRSQYEDSFVD
jgi:hypothetical protein